MPSTVAVQVERLTAGQRDRIRSQESRAVGGAITDSGDNVSRLDDVLVQTGLGQAVRTGTSDGPLLDVAVIFLCVDKNFHMRIGPVEACHRSLHSDGARTIDRPRVMCR